MAAGPSCASTCTAAYASAPSSRSSPSRWSSRPPEPPTTRIRSGSRRRAAVSASSRSLASFSAGCRSTCGIRASVSAEIESKSPTARSTRRPNSAPLSAAITGTSGGSSRTGGASGPPARTTTVFIGQECRIVRCRAARSTADRFERRGGQQAAAPERQQAAEGDHLALADELAEKERLRTEGEGEEQVAVERVPDGRAQADTEGEVARTDRREDDRLHRLADGECDHTRDRDLLQARPAGRVTDPPRGKTGGIDERHRPEEAAELLQPVAQDEHATDAEDAGGGHSAEAHRDDVTRGEPVGEDHQTDVAGRQQQVAPHSRHDSARSSEPRRPGVGAPRRFLDPDK